MLRIDSLGGALCWEQALLLVTFVLLCAGPIGAIPALCYEMALLLPNSACARCCSDSRSVWKGQLQQLENTVIRHPIVSNLFVVSVVFMLSLGISSLTRPVGSRFLYDFQCLINIQQPVFGFAWAAWEGYLTSDPMLPEQPLLAFLHGRLLIDVPLLLRNPLAAVFYARDVDYDFAESLRDQYTSLSFVPVVLKLMCDALTISMVLSRVYRLCKRARGGCQRREVLIHGCKLSYMCALFAVLLTTLINGALLRSTISDLPWFATITAKPSLISNSTSRPSEFYIPLVVRRSQKGARIDAFNANASYSLEYYWSAVARRNPSTTSGAVLFYGNASNCYDQCLPQYQAQNWTAKAIMFGVKNVIDVIAADDNFGDWRNAYSWDACANGCKYQQKFGLLYILLFVTQESYFIQLRHLVAIEGCNLTIHSIRPREQQPPPFFPPTALTGLCMPGVIFVAVGWLALIVAVVFQKTPPYYCWRTFSRCRRRCIPSCSRVVTEPQRVFRRKARVDAHSLVDSDTLEVPLISV